MNFFDRLVATISAFGAAVGMNASILDEKGEVVASFGPSYHFCTLFHAYTGDRYGCENVHSKGGLFAAKLGDCYFYLCSAQLMHISVAILEGTRYVGSVLIGPVQLSRMEQLNMESIMQRFSFSREQRAELEETLKEIPLVDANRTHYVGKLLFQIVCNLLAHGDLEITLKQRRISRQQAEIGEFLQRIGESGNLTQAQLRQEKELTEHIFNGDLISAQQLLNNIIARIYFSTSNNVELVRMQMNELVSVLARVVLQTSAATNDVYRIVSYFQRSSLDCDGLVELSQAMADSLRLFIDIVREEMSDRQNNLIKRSMQYIDANYTTRLSVEDVARHVSLSPSYFSHLFKERTGLTFSTYLTNCRVEQAKHQLRQSDIPLAELAQELGFDNQQYFSRVFKRVVGTTPGRYRKETAIT